MKRWTMFIAIISLVLLSSISYAATSTTGTLSRSWGNLSVADPYNDDVDGPGNWDGRDIYQGVWWERDDTYDYFRIDLAGAPHDTEYDWAVVYGVYMHGGMGTGAPGTDSYVPVQLSDINWVVDWHPDPAGVSDGALMNPGSTQNEVHFHTYDQTLDTWSTSDLNAADYYIAFDDVNEGAGRNTIQFRLDRAVYGLPSVYTFTGASHDLASDNPTTFDITGSATTPEPASMALMGLALAGMAAFRKRRNSD